MPDSQPPIQGPAAQRQRDLDALLSVEAGYPAVVLGPVAGALAALRAAPLPNELDGEEAARAAFRRFMLPVAGVAGVAGGADVSAPPPAVPAQFHQVAAAGAGRPGGPGSTVVLPRAVPGGPRHARPRHARPRRPVPWPGRWQVMTAAGGAAAAVIVGVAALAGAFSGPSGQPGRSALRPSPSSSASSQRATSSVLGTATARPTPRPSTTSPEALCRQFMDYFMHPEPPANWSAEDDVVQQLSKLADGRLRVIGYCARQLGMDSAHGHDTGLPGGAGNPAAGDQAGQGGSGDSGPPRFGREGSAVPSVDTRSLSGGSFRAGQKAR
jgi:hypothetical protein